MFGDLRQTGTKGQSVAVIPKKITDLYPIFERHFLNEITRLENMASVQIDISSCDARERNRDLFSEMPMAHFTQISRFQKSNDFKDALRRLKAGVLGICGNCGKLINLERIIAYPHVRYCKDCQEKKPTKIW